MQFDEELKTIPKLKGHYVKGHQDAKKKKDLLERRGSHYHDIPNVTACIQSHPVLCFHCPHLHSQPDHQFIAQHPIQTCNRYWQYLESKFNWTLPLIISSLGNSSTNSSTNISTNSTSNSSSTQLAAGYPPATRNSTPLEEQIPVHAPGFESQCNTNLRRNPANRFLLFSTNR